MEGSLTCKKCSLSYNTTDKTPIVISCGHTCCKGCYLSCIDLDKGLLNCPFEEKSFPVPNDFPVNQLIMELLALKIQPKAEQDHVLFEPPVQEP
jgi:uncharacterized protein YbaR (Trm112 family)